MTKDIDQKTGLGSAVHPSKDLAGGVFGMLTALKPVGRDREGRVLWECICDCGNTTIANGRNLKRQIGGTKSCGCMRSISRIKHFESNETWNKGKSYQNKGNEEVYATKHSWSKAILRAKGSACQECGWDKDRCDVHHIIPKSCGGENTINNGIVLCPNCHRIAHTRLKLEGVVQ